MSGLETCPHATLPDTLLCLGGERLSIAGGPWLCTDSFSPDTMDPHLRDAYQDEGVVVSSLTGYRFVGIDGQAVILWTDTPWEEVILGPL